LQAIFGMVLTEAVKAEHRSPAAKQFLAFAMEHLPEK